MASSTAFLACIAIISMLVAGSSVEAQTNSTQAIDERETIKQLLKRVADLESRIRELESKQSNAATSSSSSAAGAPVAGRPEPDSSTDQHSKSDMGAVHAGSPTLQIRGFADVGYHARDLKGETNSFGLGQLDLFVTSRISDRLTVLGELVLEANDENAFGFEIERLVLQYDHSDYFNLAIGRYHTSIGYYNTAYHHGTWFQTAAGRPFLFQFEDEGGVLPIHNVGLSANGRIPSGSLGLHYVAELGNGRASRSRFVEPVQNVVDENNGKAFNVGMFVRPDWLQGFQAGLSYYRDNLTPDSLPNFRESILAGHAVFQGTRLELLNEALVIRHRPAGQHTIFNTAGFYSQASWRIGQVRPYFRYEYINAPDGDPFLNDVGRRTGPLFGLRYDLSEFAAFKTQYERTMRRSLDPINGLTLQMAFTF